MTNKDLASAFNELGQLMELHGENPFKIRSYQKAYRTLRALPDLVADMTKEQIGKIDGVGKAIQDKIWSLLETGEMPTLEKYRGMTPEGVREMLGIKGVGPKKIRMLWKELGAESPTELLYATNENRLVDLKGFGAKTQENIRKQLEYFLKSKNKFHYGRVEEGAMALLEYLQKQLPGVQVEWTGAIRRRAIILEVVEVLVGTNEPILGVFTDELQHEQSTSEGIHQGTFQESFPVKIYTCAPEEFGSKQFRYTGTRTFQEAFLSKTDQKDFTNIDSEEALFTKAQLPFVIPELRDSDHWIQLDQQPILVEESDIKGVVHAHTRWSDGMHTIKEMAEASRDLGYQYLGLTDHSKSAFYANGLKEDRLIAQWEEVDELNKTLAPFRIFKGIESDILSSGDLDYSEDILKQFDFIIASVHSNLKMDEAKATARLIKAIENPYTTILGHPTGRLLLAREGYPIDHMKVIDACAANGVSIELNAHPYRLDLDYTWIPYAREKGIMISINPDAHSIDGIRDIRYGVLAARKGGLEVDGCLNAVGVEEFERRIGK